MLYSNNGKNIDTSKSLIKYFQCSVRHATLLLSGLYIKSLSQSKLYLANLLRSTYVSNFVVKSIRLSNTHIIYGCTHVDPLKTGKSNRIKDLKQNF